MGGDHLLSWTVSSSFSTDPSSAKKAWYTTRA